MSSLSRAFCQRLICPRTGQDVRPDGDFLYRADGAAYPVEHGIPSFRRDPVAPSASHVERPQVTLMIMTRDEEDCISIAIKEAREVLDDLELSYEVLVIDGSSTDQTVARAQEAGARVVQQSRPGYSAGFQEGVQLCRGRYIVTIDADLTHDPNFIRSLWLAREGAEMVIGSRYVSYGGAQMSQLREYLSRILNGFLRRLLDIPVKDMSSGLRLYDAAALQSLRLEGREFDVLIEVLARYLNEGYRALEVPFFYKPRIAGETKVRLGRFALAYLKATTRLFPLRHSPSAADWEFRLHDHLLSPRRASRQRWQEAFLTLLEGNISDLAIVGCGASKLAVSLPGAVCVDDDLARLRLLRHSHTMLVHADSHRLPFRSGSFAWVLDGPRSPLARALPEAAATLAEMARILRPGGHLLLAEKPQVLEQADRLGLELAGKLPVKSSSHRLLKLRKVGP